MHWKLVYDSKIYFIYYYNSYYHNDNNKEYFINCIKKYFKLIFIISYLVIYKIIIEKKFKQCIYKNVI